MFIYFVFVTTFQIQDAGTLEEASALVEGSSGLLGVLGCRTFIRTLQARDAVVEEALRAYVEVRTWKALEQ